jgi:uncharacterized protein YfaS (alpha-2-macroglobulin family)
MTFWIKHRWYLLALCALVLNGVAVWDHARTIRALNSISVESATPEILPTDQNAPLSWRFSSAMVADTKIDQFLATPPVQLFPNIKGHFLWTAVDELTFQPLENWPPCSPVTAEFFQGLESMDARKTEAGLRFNYSTEPLQVTRISQSEFSSDRIKLVVGFNEAVSPAQLKEKMTISTADGSKIPYWVSGSSISKSIDINISQIADQKITVHIQKEMQPALGQLGLQDEFTQTVDLSKELRILKVDTRSPPFEHAQMILRFNQPVNDLDLKKEITIEPAVELISASCRGSICTIAGKFTPGQHYAITVSKGLESARGDSLTESYARTAYFPNTSSSISFVAGGTYLSPKGQMQLPFRSINSGNCNVEIQQVYANNLVYLIARKENRHGYYYGSDHDGLSRRVAKFTHKMPDTRNLEQQNILDLQSSLKGKTGVFHVQIHGEKGGRSAQYVIVSDLGITVKHAEKDLLIWVNSLRTLAPSAAADVTVYSAENQVLASGKTDADGVIHLQLKHAKKEQTPFIITVQKGNDLTFLPLNSSEVALNGATGNRNYLAKGCEAFLFAERGIYRPGETMNLKAIVRDAKVRAPGEFPIKLTVTSPKGKKHQELSLLLNKWGTAETEINWPETTPTGRYTITATLPGDHTRIGRTTVLIEEFVPPQLKAELSTDNKRTRTGHPVEFAVQSSYLYGSPAADLPVQCRVDFLPAPFKSKAWPDYAFGDDQRQFEPIRSTLKKSTLDANGEASFTVETSTNWRPAAALKAVLSGTVSEIGGRGITAYASATIDAYPFYIGIHANEHSGHTKTAHRFDLITVNPDESTHTASVELQWTLDKLSWVSVLKKQGDHYEYVSEIQSLQIDQRTITTEDGSASLECTPEMGGKYRLTIVDPVSKSSSSITFYVSANGHPTANRSLEAPDIVELELDKKSYCAGETAKLTIKTPFPGKLLLTLESTEILEHRILELTNNVAKVSIPVTQEFSPNIYCSVSIIRPAVAEAIWGRHRATGRISLNIDRPDRHLTVLMDLPEKMRPASTLKIPITVLDNTSNGCASEIVVMAVDEGLCMLTEYPVPDPHRYFFEPRLPEVEQCDLYAQLIKETPSVSGGASEPGGGMLAVLRKRLNPIKSRRFKPLTLWSSTILTASNGTAEVSFDIPEFTGELRITAVATDASRSGAAAQAVKVSRSLIVQHSLPRFLAPDDTFTMPLRLENASDQEMPITVRITCSGPLSGQHLTRKATLSAGASTNLTVQLQAGSEPGNATCKIITDSPSEHIEQTVEIPVRPAATYEVLGGCETIAPGSSTTLLDNSNWLNGTRSTSLTLSGLPAVQLTGSIDYLMKYPYGCLEQTVSAAMPLLYLTDLINLIQPGRFHEGDLDEFVKAGIDHVLSMQKYNGSFSLWPDCPTYDWGSLYATHFLVEAAAAGYAVPKPELNAALNYLTTRLNKSPTQEHDDHYNRAYSCYILARAGQPNHGECARLYDIKDSLSKETRTHLAAAIAAGGNRKRALDILDELHAIPALNNHAPTLGGCLLSTEQSDALLLNTLLDTDPDSPHIPKLVIRLNNARKNGRYRSTRANAAALLALGKYTRLLQSDPLPASGILTDSTGRETRLDKLAEVRVFHPQNHVTIRNTGDTPLYCFWKDEGVPKTASKKEVDRNLEVRRRLLDKDGMPIDPTALIQGEIVIVHITVHSEGPVDNLVIEDLLPAGLEVENANLKTSQLVSMPSTKQTLPVLHKDLRDDRVLLFTGSFSGTQSYSYAVRAVTEGTFVLPPISATCMVDENIHSTHGAGHVAILSTH